MEREFERSLEYYRKRQRQRSPSRVWPTVAALLTGFAGGALCWLLAGAAGTSAAGSPASSSFVYTEEKAPVAVAEDVAAIACPSVVEVTTESKKTHPFFGSYVTGGAGSGVVLSRNGVIVTNHHVISDCETVTVRLQSGEEYPAEVLGADAQTDLAALKIEAEGLEPVTLADSSEIAVGQPAIAIGNPLGTLGGTVTEGIISAKDREIVVGSDTMTLLQTSAAINPGNSGGGLFDRYGRLIGVVNAKSAGSNIEGLGFAIPANTVREVVDDLLDSGYVTGRPALGITVMEVNTAEALRNARVASYGVYVTYAADDTGLKSGDRLLEIDGEKIDSAASLRKALNSRAVGDSVVVVVHRDGESASATVTLREKTPDTLK